MIVKAILILAVLLVCAIAGLAGYRAFRQHQGAERLVLAGPDAIAEAGFVRIGGIEQWVTIRGEDRANPVLVIVHGGPGAAFQLVGYAALRPWERDFTIVHWDQRGAGRTFGRNGAQGSGELSIDRIAADGLEVVEHALARTGQRKAILLGASWGSILGIEMARRRPELFHAYVGAGQVVDMQDNEAVGYDLLLKKVRAAGDAKAEAKLIAIGPPPYAGLPELARERQVLTAHPPQTERGLIPRLLGVALLAPDTRLKDIYDWISAQKFSIDRLYEEMMAYSDRDAARPIPVPVVIIQGDEDIQTPTALARAYFDRLQAPRKEFVLIPGGGHTAVIAMPEAFHAALKQHVRPLAHPADTS
jgi:proline iminopeptidase